MHPIVLKKEVSVNGRDLFGRKAKITFYPIQGKERGWWWLMDKETFSLEMLPNIVHLGKRRTKLVAGVRKLEVFEHIGSLRWFGLCDLVIESTSWPPFHGRPLELWEAIKNSCEKDTSRDIPWYTLKEPVRWTYPKCRAGLTAFTEISPSTEKRLKIRVIGKYLGLPPYQLTYVFPDPALEEILAVHSQGLPSMLYHLLKIPSLFGWPHHDKFVWQQNHAEEEIWGKFVQHRVADLLGILTFLCRDGLLSADVTSVCSGHKADINVVMTADSLLHRL